MKSMLAATFAALLVFVAGTIRATPLESSPDPILTIDEISSNFGHWVSSAGDVNGDGYDDVIAVAPRQGQFEQGQALVYLGSATGLMSTPVWTTSPAGYRVSGAGDVNDDGYDDVLIGLKEGVELFFGSAAGPSAQPDWSVALPGEPANIGRQVAGAGDVNGDGYDDVLIGQGYAGPVYVHFGSATGPSNDPDWVNTGGTAGGLFFGGAVASAGDVNRDGYADIIVGAIVASVGGQALVYHGSAAGLPSRPDVTLDPEIQGIQFGSAVASAGDVDRDGYDDVIVGARYFGTGTPVDDRGAAFVYHGSPAGVSTEPAWVVEGLYENGELGCSVASAGDPNTDAFSDVIVGQRRYPVGSAGSGRALVFLGSSTGLSTEAAWQYDASDGGSLLGQSVSSAGDVNGDGAADALVGSPFYGVSTQLGGAVFVFEGTGQRIWDCGNGLREYPEECDAGPGNSNEPGATCRTNCTAGGCGDNIIDPGEECDGGRANSFAPGAICRPDCTLARCGDGILDPGEECDLGEDNSDHPEAVCRTNCTFNTVTEEIPTITGWGAILMAVLFAAVGVWVFRYYLKP